MQAIVDPGLAPEQINSRRATAVIIALSILTGSGGFGLGWFTSRIPDGSVWRFLSRTFASQPARLTPPSQTTPLPTGTVVERLAALDALVAAADSGGIDPRVRVARARLLLQEAQSPNLALADLRPVLAGSDSEYPEALYLDVLARLAAGDLHAALLSARTFVRKYPRSWRGPEVICIAARVLDGADNTTDAILLLERFLSDEDRGTTESLSRDRYAHRLDRVLLMLGHLYLRTDRPAMAEAAFSSITRPGLNDRGGFCVRGTLQTLAEAGWCEAVLLQSDSRGNEARRRAESLASRDDDAGAYARLLLGRDESFPGERILAHVLRFSLPDAAREAELVECDPGVASRIVRALWPLARTHAPACIRILRSFDAALLEFGPREDWHIELARALDSTGRPDDALGVLADMDSGRAHRVRADMLRAMSSESAPSAGHTPDDPVSVMVIGREAER